MCALATLGVAFAILVTLVQAHRLARFEVRSFDLAIFAQGLIGLGHGHPRSSIQETSFLAVHFSPLLFALAPLARLAGSATPLLLVFVQGLALGACAPFAYLLARPAGRGAALVLGAVSLAHPGVRALALDGFHDVTLGVPLALLLALAIERAWSARALLLAALALALLADEVFPLVLPGAAVWLFVARRRREAASLLVLGAASFVLVNFVVLGSLRGGALHVESLYAHWRSGEQLARFLRSGAVSETLAFALALVGPLAFLPLARPTRLAPAAIVFALSAASLRSAQRSIHEHYHAPVTPFVLAAAAAALVRLEERWPGRGARAGAALLLAATLAANLLAPDPRAELASDLRDLRAGPPDPRGALVALIPEDASVLASVDFLHALVARDQLSALPGALRGTKDWSDVPYELPRDLDFVLADTMDSASWPPDASPGHAASLDRRWEEIALGRGLGVRGVSGSTVLLGRGGPPLVLEVEPTGTPRAVSDDLSAPLLAAAGDGTLVWAPPTRASARHFYVRNGGGGVRPLLWRLGRGRPWPAGRFLRERVGPGDDVAQPGALVLIEGP